MPPESPDNPEYKCSKVGATRVSMKQPVPAKTAERTAA